MPFYYYIAISILLVLLVYIFRIVRTRVNNLPVELFHEALRNENKGDYLAALHSYESALNEVNKSKYSHTDLRLKILAKLKLLNTVINYENTFPGNK
jgi:hypothetical protein